MAYQGQQWLDLGPCQVDFNNVVLGQTANNPGGGTHGGVGVQIATQTRETMRDVRGSQPYDRIVVGTQIQVVCNLTGMSLEQLVSVIPGTTLGSGSSDKQMNISSAVGLSARANALALILKPIDSGAVMTAANWITFALAWPRAEIDFLFDLEQQKVFQVIFEIFDDATGLFGFAGLDS